VSGPGLEGLPDDRHIAASDVLEALTEDASGPVICLG
jgi:hypothetical protein